MLLQGFESLARSSSYWTQTPDYWGFTLASWIFIAVFVALVVFARLRFGKKALEMVGLLRMDLFNGIAPRIIKDQSDRFQPKWKKLLKWFLNFL